MKAFMWLAAISLIAPFALNAAPVAEPVTSSARDIFKTQSAFIVSAAEEMPADKYGFRPTAGQRTFGEIVSHVAESSNMVCSLLSDNSAPKEPKANKTDSKEKLLAALKASFEFCGQSLANLHDSQMGDTVTFHGTHYSRARALFELTDDVNDHYAQMAGYLRLNGLTPPSAKPKE
jgi:uncharacterized damage-inducible protein DinB